MTTTDDVVALSRALLRERDLAGEVYSGTECRSGGNNRVVVLRTDRGLRVAKLYFTDAHDHRDRLRSEYAFLEYATGIGLRCLPRPIAAFPDQRLAFYEHVEGTPLAPGNVTGAHVEQAIDFFRALNRGERADAAELPPASEACFSITDHLQLVERRLARLHGLGGGDPLDREAVSVVREIVGAWEVVRARVGGQAARFALEPAAPLAPADRCVSPSDFGFHNALVRPSGDVVFLDFEYAGWDDPAKAVGDFFCQPQVPVERRWLTRVARGFTAHAPSAAALDLRARMLLPVFWLKWCVIRLNEFTPEALRRRLFAAPGTDVAARKRERLEQTRQALAELPALSDALDAADGTPT